MEGFDDGDDDGGDEDEVVIVVDLAYEFKLFRLLLLILSAIE